MAEAFEIHDSLMSQVLQLFDVAYRVYDKSVVRGMMSRINFEIFRLTYVHIHLLVRKNAFFGEFFLKRHFI